MYVWHRVQTTMDVMVSELQSYWSMQSKQSHNADINECSVQIVITCTNTIGTLCSCNSGYELESDQRTCVGK